jgi:hydroxymethylbilane synthase
LATTQTGHVCDMLRGAHPGLECELVLVETTGDRIRDRPLREAGGKGLFVKELDEALTEGRIDCAVHSLKDVPSVLPDGISLAGVPERLDPRDVLLSREGWTPADVPDGAVVGTTSLRRGGQLLEASPAANVQTLRGNVETRIRRIVDGDFDATFLASAGLKRLGVDAAPLVAVPLEATSFVPAPGQGTLCVAALSERTEVTSIVSAVDHTPTRLAAEAERALAAALGGSCYVPLGAYAVARGDDLDLVGIVVSPDGRRRMRASASGAAGDATALGKRVADELLSAGAGEVIAAAERMGKDA